MKLKLTFLILVDLILSRALAVTNVDSTILVDTTFRKSQSPYNILKPVLIKQPAVVTIEAGVKVTANGFTGNNHAALFTVEAKAQLKIVGSKSDPVVFQSTGRKFVAINSDLGFTVSAMLHNVLSKKMQKTKSKFPIILYHDYHSY